MEQKDLLNTGYNMGMQQNLPNATTALVLGIISIVGSFCYGVVGIICGIVGLILANKDKKLYRDSPELYTQASNGTSNAGRVCSIIGIVISSLIIVLVLICVIIFGLAFSSQAFK